MFAGIQVKIEAAAQLVIFVIQLEETHFRMPHIDIGTLFGGNAINTLNHFKQAVNGFVFREIRAQLLIANTVEMLFLFFAVVSDIPRLQFIDAKLGFGESTQLSQLFFALRTRAFCQVGQEIEDLLRIFSHFGGQRFKGVAVKAQQLRQLVTQREDLRHHRAVIPFPGVRALIGGAGGIGAIHLFAQRLIVAVGHHRQIARNIQRQQISFLLFRLRLGLSGGQRAFRHACEIGDVGHQLVPAHGGIKHVVAVQIAKLREARGDFTVAFLRFCRQANPG